MRNAFVLACFSLGELSYAREFREGFRFNETELGWNGEVAEKNILKGSICENAATWLYPPVPYNQQAWYNGYRTDCSGYVSMAWGLGASYVTWTLPQVSHPIQKDELQAGDILLNIDEHVLIFESWANPERTYYNAYEETPPQAVYHVVEYPYWSGSDGVYLPYRLNGYIPSDDGGSYYYGGDDGSYYYDDGYYYSESGKATHNKKNADHKQNVDHKENVDHKKNGYTTHN
jgi:hypothetical protein